MRWFSRNAVVCAHLDVRVHKPDGSAIVCGDERHCTLTNSILQDLAELVAGLLLRDTVDNKAAVGVKEQTEVLVSLFNRDDIHEACWVCGIRAYLAVHLNEALHQN